MRMKRVLALCLSILLLCDVPFTVGAAATFTAESITTADIAPFRFWLYTPAEPTAGMPLIVYLHGGSGKGDDLTLITAVDGFPKYLMDGTLGALNAYVVIPQLPGTLTGWTNAGASLMALINHMKNTYGVDPDNISLTGHSMGGTGTWGVALAYPATFARIAPLSGSVRNNILNVSKLRNVPVRAFVGAADTIVSPDSSLDFVAALQEAGGDAAVTSFPGATHFDVPSLVYLDKDIDIVNWLIDAPEADPPADPPAEEQALFTVSIGEFSIRQEETGYSALIRASLTLLDDTPDIKVMEYGVYYATDIDVLNSFVALLKSGGDTAGMAVVKRSYATSETGLSKVYGTFAFRFHPIRENRARAAAPYIIYEADGVQGVAYGAAAAGSTMLGGYITGIGPTLEFADEL